MPSRIVGVNGNIGSGKDTVADLFVKEGYVKVSLADPMKRLAYRVFTFTEDQLWGPSDSRNAVDPRYYKGSDEWKTAWRSMYAYSMPWLRELLPESEEDVIYEAQQSLLRWFEELRDKHSDLSPRVCLQLLGTEWGRQTLEQNIWVKYLERTSKRILSGTHTYDTVYGLELTPRGSPGAAGVVVPDIRFENELMYFHWNSYPVIKVVRPDTDAEAAKTGVLAHSSELEQAGFDPVLFDVTITNDGTLEELLTHAALLATTYK